MIGAQSMSKMSCDQKMTYFPGVDYTVDITGVHASRAVLLPLPDHLGPSLCLNPFVGTLPSGKTTGSRCGRVTVSIERTETAIGGRARNCGFVTARASVSRGEGVATQEIRSVVSGRGAGGEFEASSRRGDRGTENACDSVDQSGYKAGGSVAVVIGESG